MALLGAAGSGMGGVAGMARCCLARLCELGQVEACPGLASCGMAGEASFVGSWRVTVRPGLAWQARRVETWHVEAR